MSVSESRDFPNLGLGLTIDKKTDGFLAEVETGLLLMSSDGRNIYGYIVSDRGCKVQLHYDPMRGRLMAINAVDFYDQSYSFMISQMFHEDEGSTILWGGMLERNAKKLCESLPWIEAGIMRVEETASSLAIYDAGGFLRVKFEVQPAGDLIISSDSWSEPVWQVTPRGMTEREYLALNPQAWRDDRQAATIAGIIKNLLNDQIRPAAV